MARTLAVQLFILMIGLICLPSVSLGQDGLWKQSLSGTGYAIGLNPYNPSSAFAQGSDGALYFSGNGGITWTLRSDPGIPDIRQIIVHPADTMTILTVGFSSGLKRSTDGGVTWTIVLANYGIDGESIGYDPLHPDTMYAGNYGNGNIYRSTDRGAKWVLTGSTGGWICSIAVRPDSSNILYAGTGSGEISKSTDMGATWRVVKTGGADETPRIAIDPAHPLVAYATEMQGLAGGGGLWKTGDGGETWALEALSNISAWSLDIDRTNTSTLYVGTFDPNITAVYKSTDGGSSWTSLSGGLPAGTDMWNIKIHPLQPARPWLALAQVFSPPSGVFRLTTPLAEIHAVVRDSTTGDTVKTGFVRLSPDGDSTNLAATGGTFGASYFAGDTVITPIAHIEAYPFYPRDLQLMFIQDSIQNVDIRLLRLPTASITGTVRDSATQHPVRAHLTLTASTSIGLQVFSDSSDPSGKFTFSNLYVSEPPVVRYQSLSVDPPFPLAERSVVSPVFDSSGLMIVIDLSPADILIVAGADTNAYEQYYRDVLDSLRVTYNVWNPALSERAPFSRVVELRRNTLLLYTGDMTLPLTPAVLDSLDACRTEGSNLFLTGQNIVHGNDSSGLFLNDFGVSHVGNTIFSLVSGANGGLFGGLQFFTSGGTGAHNQLRREVLRITGGRSSPDPIYGASGTGNFVAGARLDGTAGAGRAILLGFGFESINADSTRKEILRRVMGFFDGTIIVNAPTDRSPTLPTAYQLEQNYPNPFNPSTTIRYQLPSASHVTLKVFDVLGREVSVLVDRTQQPGWYDLGWNGSECASGLYLCRIEVEPIGGGISFTAWRKALLIK